MRVMILGLHYLAIFPHVAAQVTNNPTASNFLRRAWHGSAVLGDFVFIDGGQLSQLIDGKPEQWQGDWFPFSRQNNVTLSIDLRKSWTNSSLLMRTTSQGFAPLLEYSQYWVHPDGKSFYLWNGQLGYATDAENTLADSLWKFSSDGTGGGIWVQEPITYTPPSSATPQILLRPGGQGCSTTIGDIGYYVGGRVWGWSDMKADPTGYFQNTITSFNMSSGIWSNDLVTSIGSVGTVEGACAQSITTLGLDALSLDKRGLIILIGGRDPGTNVTAPIANYYDLGNVTIYDPYIDVWYAQKAGGDVPSPREQFCAVTVPGDNNTYEIFIYGGIYRPPSEDTSVAVYSDVYVLSIPGFVWFSVPEAATTPARYSHTCELVGSRQLMSIGGLNNPQAGLNEWADFQIPDPFTQGVGIFDMTDMAWKAAYNANAPPYQSPQIVKDWYAEGNQASVPWQSLELARLFIQDTPVSVSPTPTATVSGTAGPIATGQNDNNDVGNRIGLGVGIPGLIGAFVGVWYTWKTYRLKRAKSPKTPAQKSAPVSNTSDLSNQAVPLEEPKTNVHRLPSQNGLAEP